MSDGWWGDDTRRFPIPTYTCTPLQSPLAHTLLEASRPALAPTQPLKRYRSSSGRAVTVMTRLTTSARIGLGMSGARLPLLHMPIEYPFAKVAGVVWGYHRWRATSHISTDVSDEHVTTAKAAGSFETPVYGDQNTPKIPYLSSAVVSNNYNHTFISAMWTG